MSKSRGLTKSKSGAVVTRSNKLDAHAALMRFIGSPEDSLVQYKQKLPQDTRDRLETRRQMDSIGLDGASVLVCEGYNKCPFKSKCPIPRMLPTGIIDPGPAEQYPIGSQCISEAEYYREQLAGFYAKWEVDAEDPAERNAAQEIADTDVMIRRTAWIASIKPEFTHKDESVSDRGEAVGMVIGSSTKMHPAFELREKLVRRRSQLLKEFISTREAVAAHNIKSRELDQNASKQQRVLDAVNRAVKDMARKVQAGEIVVDAEEVLDLSD